MKKNISILLFTLFLSLSVTPFMQLEAKASSKSESSESKTVYGSFYTQINQNNLIFMNDPPFNLQPGNTIPFDRVGYQTKGLSLNASNGNITIEKKGVYLIAYGAHIESINCWLELQLDGKPVARSKFQAISHNQTNALGVRSIIIHVKENAKLTVNMALEAGETGLIAYDGAISASITIQELKGCESKAVYGSYCTNIAQQFSGLDPDDRIIFDIITSQSEGISLNPFDGTIKIKHEGQYLISYGADLTPNTQTGNCALELRLNNTIVPGSTFGVQSNGENINSGFTQLTVITHVAKNSTLTVNLSTLGTPGYLNAQHGAVSASITIRKVH